MKPNDHYLEVLLRRGMDDESLNVGHGCKTAIP